MERKYRTPRTVDEVFQYHRGRRQGMLRALTTERETLYQSCNPADTNLCLYSYPDGSWEVSSPADEIPSELPEPCLGINFAREGMRSQDWLSLVAAHSDAWLFAVTFFYTTNFSKKQRTDLFELINGFPTLFEVVTGQASAKQNGGSARSGANTAKSAPVPKEEVDEDSEGNEDEEEEEEEAYCGACQGSYSSSSSQFWILCDVCDRWFHGKCVKVSAAKAQQIDKYRCPSCIKKRPHP